MFFRVPTQLFDSSDATAEYVRPGAGTETTHASLKSRTTIAADNISASRCSLVVRNTAHRCGFSSKQQQNDACIRACSRINPLT